MTSRLCTYPLFFLLIFLVHELRADPCCDPSLELKTGYFFFADKTMRSIYNQGGFDIQLAGSVPFWESVQLYGAIEYLRKKGHSLNGQQKTSIWQIPVTFGLKTHINLCEAISCYLILAPRYFYCHVHNDSPFVDRNLHKNGIGGFIGTGLTWQQRANSAISFFAEYSYEKVHFHSSITNVYARNVQIGGFVFGGSLGYSF